MFERKRPRRPRLLVFNQYYWPGVEATAHLLSELCASLAVDFDVTVVTGALRGAEAAPSRERHRGVEVIRVRSSSFDRRNLVLRALNYVTYFFQSFVASLSVPRPDIVLCMTDPPFIADVALIVARRHRAPLVVVSQDVFPEIAVALGRLENPLIVEVLKGLVGFYLKRADRVVAIGERMRERLIEKGAAPDRIVVIPNWVDATAIEPRPRDNEWGREHDLVDRFVVMHSGNVGHAQNLDALVRSAMFLRDLDDLAVVIVGTGARHQEFVSLAQRLELDAIRFLPYQPREVLSQSLSVANVHVVGLARGLAGYVVPSRLYGILSAGRPVIVAAEDRTETADLVRRVGCGLVVPPGRPEALAAVIRDAYDGKLDLERMGQLGREYVLEEADRTRAIGRYRTLMDELLAVGSP